MRPESIGRESRGGNDRIERFASPAPPIQVRRQSCRLKYTFPPNLIKVFLRWSQPSIRERSATASTRTHQAKTSTLHLLGQTHHSAWEIARGQLQKVQGSQTSVIVLRRGQPLKVCRRRRLEGSIRLMAELVENPRIGRDGKVHLRPYGCQQPEIQ
jgi:hypothetical protein